MMQENDTTPSAATIVCITGGIGSGKSVVSRCLRLRGYSVYDCDSRAKRLMNTSRSIRTSLIEKFGQKALTDNGEIDREFLASRIFSDKAAREWLNPIVHAEVRSDIMDFARKCIDGCGIKMPVFVESAIPTTAQLDRLCSSFWLVTAPLDVKMQRIKARNNFTADHITARIESQAAEFDTLPKERTDILINDDASPLLPQIDSLLKNLD